MRHRNHSTQYQCQSCDTRFGTSRKRNIINEIDCLTCHLSSGVLSLKTASSSILCLQQLFARHLLLRRRLPRVVLSHVSRGNVHDDDHCVNTAATKTLLTPVPGHTVPEQRGVIVTLTPTPPPDLVTSAAVIIDDPQTSEIINQYFTITGK